MPDLDLPNLRAIAEAAAQRPTRYLATFDPPTALRIVNTLEEAYREINRYRCEAREAFAAQTLARDLRLAAAEARAEAAEAKLAAAVEEAPMSDATEAAAIALYKIVCEIGGEPPRWDDISPDSQAVYRIEARAAIEAYEANAWRPIEEYAIFGEEFHVLDAHGDLIKVKRHDISGAIEPRTGRWFHAAKFGRAVPDPPPAIAALPLEEMPAGEGR